MANTVKVGITATDEGFKSTMDQLKSSANSFGQSLDKAGGKMKTLDGAARQAAKEAKNLAYAYEQLDDTAKNSEFGKQLQAQLDIAIDAAGRLKDIKSDVQTAINNRASDTAAWDAAKEGISSVGNAATALIGIYSSLAGESETAAQTLKYMATMQATVNAVVTIGNALQKQSALMMGISTLQTKAAAAAKALETKATIGATAAQRVFNAVAKANPYVLLASAVIAVGAALVGFAKNSAEAKKEEEAFQAQEEKNKKTMDVYSNSVVENSAEMIVKFKALEEANKKANKTTEEQTRIFEAAKPIAEALGQEINNYNEADQWIAKSGPAIVNALVARAKAMANYAIAIEEAKEMIKQLAEQETQVENAASYIGKRMSSDMWAKAGIDQKYLKPVYETRTSIAHDQPIEQQMLVGYEFDNEGYKKMKADLARSTEELNKRITDKITKRISAAVSDANAASALLKGAGSSTPRKTPHKTGKGKSNTSKEQQTQVEKINKLLQEQEKKLENINSENDKDGTKKKAIYQEMLKLNEQLEAYYDVDDTGFEKLKNILFQELKLVEANSDEWTEIKEKIRDINEDRILVLAQRGNDGLEEMIDLLKENRSYIQQGTEEWNELTKQIQEAEILLAQLNVDHVAGSIGYISDLISNLENIKINIDIETEEGRKQLIDITNQIAELTSEQNIIDILINDFSFDRFETKYDKLLEKYKNNKEIEIIIKQNILTEGEEEITKLSQLYTNGFIDYDKIKSDYDKMIEYMSSKGIDTTNITQSLQTAIQNVDVTKAVNVFKSDSSIEGLVGSLKDIKQKLVDLGTSSNDVFTILKDAGISAFNELQTMYDSGLIDANEFREQAKTLAEILREELGIKVNIEPQIDEAAWKKHVDGAAGALNSLGEAMSSIASATEDEGLAVAGIIAKAIANIALAASEAIVQAASGSAGGPWGWIAFGAAAMAEMAGMIASIHSATGMAEGGIVGGSTTIGDRIVTRLNAGEMVLNRRQQANLFNMLDNGKTNNTDNSLHVSSIRVKGSDLYLALSNYGKITGKKL